MNKSNTHPQRQSSETKQRRKRIRMSFKSKIVNTILVSSSNSSKVRRILDGTS